VHAASKKEGLMIWSPEGEMVFITWDLRIPADEATLNNVLQGLNFVLQAEPNPVVARNRVELMSRYLSRPLKPVEVIQRLCPHVNAPLVRNMKALDSEDLSPLEKRIFLTGGRAGKHVRYQYTFHGGHGNPLLLERFPPFLLNQAAVPMEGKTMVVTGPVSWPNGAGMNYWPVTMVGKEAPTALFKNREVCYEAILGSLQANLSIPRDQEHERRQAALVELACAAFAGHTLYYSNDDNAVYSLSQNDRLELARRNGEVVSRGGQHLQRATLDDVMRARR
jgi:hypothetical protein